MQPSVWLRYISAPGAAPVDARFNPKPDPAVMAEFLNLCATRLGLTLDDEPGALIEERVKRDGPRLAEYHR